ncbi:acetyl-CoA acetyltransferase [Myxococcota bacterium]|nr:acetyl-CoA acetyltransferase [Myxococcota bacterium]
MDSENLARNRSAITGVGYTPLSRASGLPVDALALNASIDAIRDAGLTPQDIDGVVSYAVGDSALVRSTAQALGLEASNWYVDLFGGGSFSCLAVANAAMAVSVGLCRHVLVYRALNGRSGRRFGRSASAELEGVGGAEQFTVPFGQLAPVHNYGMLARRHMIEYGTTTEQLGHVAVTLRSNAVENDRAIMRHPITLEDHRESRWIADPFRLLDCCQETDGACALVVSRSDIARDLPHPPAYLSSFAIGGRGASALAPDKVDDFTTFFPAHIAPGLFARAGIEVGDIDLAALYDAFTFLVIGQLEDFGFCPKGEGGPFVADGNIARDGTIPVGTNGGLLSEGYVHGLNNVLEAVSQLRGKAGTRQVDGVEVALASGWGANVGSALILSRGA